MLRNVAPRPVRTAAAAAGALGVLALAACAPAEAEPADDAPASGTAATSSPAEGDSGAAAGDYVDGVYTAEGSYQTPETVETVTVTITLAGDVVTDVEVVGDPKARESQQYQGFFIGGIADEVVGKDIDEVSVSRVAGSSLTSGGFMKALQEIKAEAAA
ncbi:hypothetical protein [Microbacterium sp. GXF7504]